jgi:hypothetical protein
MRRVLTFACVVVATFFVSTGVAHANQTKHYSGLYLKNGNGKILSEIDRTTNANNLFQKLTNTSDGDQMHVQAPWRDRAPGNGNSVYVRVDWSKNGSYCYLSGIGVSQNGGSVSVSCSNGWNNYGNESKSKHIEDSGWWFFNAGKPFDESSDSIRAAVMTCEDHSFAGDPCSGKRFGGISY